MNSSLWMENNILTLPDMGIGSGRNKKVSSSSFSTMGNSSKYIYSPILSQQSVVHITADCSAAEYVTDTEESVTCTWCKVVFQSKISLLNHIQENHRTNKVHRCLECSKVFTQKSNLKAHHRLHTGEKPFKCTYCPKMFAQKSNLMNHLSVHTRDKPFCCPFCKRAFSQRSNLKSHIFTHTGERPFKCQLCTKEFVQKSNLVSHVRTHTSEKPHHCDFCDKSFSQRSNLISHLKLHAKTNVLSL